MTATNIYVANTSGSAEVDGVEYQFNIGLTNLRTGHPLLTACPAYFDLVGADGAADTEAATQAPDVEQATSGPGEKRNR